MTAAAAAAMAFGLVRKRPLQSSSIPPPRPSIALQLGASVEVSRHAIPLTVIKTIPTPIIIEKT